MDAVGFGKAVLFAVGESGPAAIVFAATRPERTRALVLSGTFSAMEAGWDDIDRDPDELRAVARAELGADYMPSTEQMTRMQEFARAVRSAWGTGAVIGMARRSPRSLRQFAMLERMCASPGMARASFEAMFRIDVRPILPTITVPTLVIHGREDPIPVQYGRYLADHIAGARYLEVDGAEHVPWFTADDRILTEIEEFLTGSQPHRRRHTAPCAPCCSPTWSPRPNTPRQRATSGGGRCCSALGRSPPTTRNASAARWSKAPATATSPRSTARRRPSVAPRPYALTPRPWASRSAPASTPASANCWTPTSGGSPYTSRRGSRPGRRRRNPRLRHRA